MPVGTIRHYSPDCPHNKRACISVTVSRTGQSLGFRETPVCKPVLNLKLHKGKEDSVTELKPESGLVPEH